MMRIGVDLGGTKIEAIALDEAGRERARRRIASPSHDYAQVIAEVRGLVDALEDELGVRASVGAGERIGTRGDGTAVVAPFDGVVVFPNADAQVGQEWFYLARDSTRWAGAAKGERARR